MVTIAVMIGTAAGVRLLAAASEREAALMAEATIFSALRDALPVPIWIQCADTALITWLPQ